MDQWSLVEVEANELQIQPSTNRPVLGDRADLLKHHGRVISLLSLCHSLVYAISAALSVYKLATIP